MELDLSGKKSQSRRAFLKNCGRITLFSALALLAYKLLGTGLFGGARGESCRQSFICSHCTLLASCTLPPALSRKGSGK